jgi:hypothetical protein
VIKDFYFDDVFTFHTFFVSHFVQPLRFLGASSKINIYYPTERRYQKEASGPPKEKHQKTHWSAIKA